MFKLEYIQFFMTLFIFPSIIFAWKMNDKINAVILSIAKLELLFSEKYATKDELINTRITQNDSGVIEIRRLPRGRRTKSGES